MSDILRACLVKEWREQRHIVLAVAVLAPFAVVACCFLLPGDRVDIEGVLSKVAASCGSGNSSRQPKEANSSCLPRRTASMRWGSPCSMKY